ncbi:coiled-coil domain-containing protein 178-like [Saccostrea cucullata]|uniref:coiled-coil domain-containing protein 178-like n=1 Tax=Saccostrea cuccullata TaxID=36930 RepID=UPI002ED3F65A
MSTVKVVRVEDIERSNTEDFPKGGSEEHLSQNAEYLNTTELDEPDNEAEEIQDKVYPLPQDWPKIPQIFRRKSCELTNNTTPCVNKAVSHLELIQGIIEEWFKEREEECKEQVLPMRPVGSKKQLRFSKSSEDDVRKGSGDKRGTSALSRKSGSTDRSSLPSTPLSIHGVGAVKDTEEKPEGGLEIPYLGAEDVIEEVITLLARLENDKIETEKFLRNEEERVERLSNKIDNLCLRRMTELPAIVQREHEACIMDLNELTWHCNYGGRNEQRVKNKTSAAELLNKRLKDDIAFVKKHIPLVEEKLELEKLAMEKIKNAQSSTTTELDNTKERQEKTKSKSQEAEKKAQSERGHIKKELDTVRDALSAISEEYSQAKMTFNAYIHQVNDMQQQLKDNDEELKVLDVKNENAKVAEEMQAAKVREIQTKIAEAEFEHNRLENENIQLQQELVAKKQKNDSRIRDLENKVKAKDGKLRTILLKNQEAEMEVQDFYDKISDCQRQKVADEKNITRIKKEMMKLGQQMAVTMEEYNKVLAINQSIREQLQTEEEKAFKMEESLKGTADTLRRQVKDEVHTRTVLVARISNDTTDLSKYKTDTQVKNQKAKKVADDVVNVVNEVKTKVEKLRSAKRDRLKKKSTLQDQLKETEKQEEESKQRFKEKLGNIEPHHKQLKENVLALDKRLDHMEWKTEQMERQMDDWDREAGTMERLTSNTQKAIDELTEVLEELTLQLESAKKIEEGLRNTYNQSLDRYKINEQNHRKFKDERAKFLKKTELEMAHKLAVNKELASKYRQAQNEYLTLKDKLLNNFDDRVKLEAAIKDCRQLQSLQKRMHAAMMEYFKYRGLYNQSELGKLESESMQNTDKVIELQEEMNTALQKISEFLETQMDGKTARKIAWDAIKKQQQQQQQRQMGSLPVIPPIRQESMALA